MNNILITTFFFPPQKNTFFSFAISNFKYCRLCDRGRPDPWRSCCAGLQGQYLCQNITTITSGPPPPSHCRNLRWIWDHPKYHTSSNENRKEEGRKKKKRGKEVCGKTELCDSSLTFSHWLSKGNYFIKQSETIQHSVQITYFTIIAISHIAIILHIWKAGENNQVKKFGCQLILNSFC